MYFQVWGGERSRGGQGGASLARGPPRPCSVRGGELADVGTLLGAVGAGPHGEACRRDGPGVGGERGERGAPALPGTAPPVGDRGGGGGWGCQLRPSAGDGHGVRHSLLRWVSIPQVPPRAPFPVTPLRLALYLSPLVHCQARLCAGRGGSEARPRCPQRPPQPPTHLLPVAEAKPDGLYALVVGDDVPQDGCLPRLLHPGQVGTIVAGLALPLQGEPWVPGHAWPMGDPRPPLAPASLPQPRPRSGAD